MGVYAVDGWVAAGIALAAAVVSALVTWLAVRARAEARIAALDATLASERAAAEEKLSLLATAETRLREAFAALSGEALRSNTQSFLELARSQLGAFQEAAGKDLAGRQQAIGELVAPLRESLVAVDAKIQDLEKARAGAYASLSEQVRGLAETEQRLQAEAANLAGALRATSMRGRWGEMQLRRVVELADMVAHCDFQEQPTVAGDDGRLRPDLVVRLPGGKSVVVDAKVPLTAYLEAHSASSDADRDRLFVEHARRVRQHMTALGGKAYWEQFEQSPDFVVMFLPGEGVFSAALNVDPVLIEFGVESHVIPASPTTLISLLRAVAYGWRQERLAENAHAISDLGAQLHERLGTLVGHFDKVGKSLDRAVDAYNDAVGSFERRVLVSARRLRELGAAHDELPELEPVDQRTRSLESGDLFPTLPLARR
jgi:DNA recombination protein RmuC